VRWRYDTRRPGTLCNLNASVALGRHGLATASASGEVIYLPYDAVPPAAPEAPAADGVRLVVCGPGGAAGDPVGPADALGVRVLHTAGGVTRPGRILEASAPLCPDGSQVHVIADGAPEVRLRGRYAVGDEEHAFDGEVAIPCVASEPGPPPSRFRAERLAIQAPSIVPSFDQIGLASLSIDIGLLASEGHRVVAWGVQRFGMDEDGNAVGVPAPRVLLYAFDGTCRDGTLVLESGECLFEITAFPVPLTRLRLVAHRREGAWRGGSLLAEADARTALRALPSLLSGGAPGRLRTWLPEHPRPSDLLTLASIGWRTLALVPALLGGMWRPWGLLDERLRFRGIGSFRLAEAPPRESAMELVDAGVHGERVVARWRSGTAADAPGILLLRDGRPVSWAYTRRLDVRREGRAPVRCTLDARGADWDEAWVLRDHERVARLPRR
jgi:hypothetical protein